MLSRAWLPPSFLSVVPVGSEIQWPITDSTEGNTSHGQWNHATWIAPCLKRGGEGEQPSHRLTNACGDPGEAQKLGPLGAQTAQPLGALSWSGRWFLYFSDVSYSSQFFSIFSLRNITCRGQKRRLRRSGQA